MATRKTCFYFVFYKKFCILNFVFILRIHVLPIEKESMYRIFGKLVNIFLMLIEMSVRDDVAVRPLEKSCKYMWKTNCVVERVMMLHNFDTNVLISIYFFTEKLEKLSENMCDVW